MGWVKDQLSGNILAEIGENSIGSINKSLQIDNFSSGFVEWTSPGTKTVSLEKWVRYSLVHPTSKALFGESTRKVDTQFVFYCFAFEEAAWEMLHRYPKFLAQDLYGAAESILRTIWLPRPSGTKSSASTPRPPSSAFRPPTVEGLTINTGDQVLSPFRQLNLKRENFGPDAATGDPDRFVKTKQWRRSMGYNPVGGGATHCPGRILAKQEVYTFVAVVLYRFEVKLVEPKLPTVNAGSRVWGL
ncbi:MAG: hypothetical protein LQ343_003885 [Gyalolechia ehrenbergii]|nr:MAG: hypothetical protein LQ343_003885 [Gyalolechia ehrenbergii]